MRLSLVLVGLASMLLGSVAAQEDAAGHTIAWSQTVPTLSGQFPGPVYAERSPTASNLSVENFRAGRRMWIKLQERPRPGNPAIETQLGDACQARRPTRRTRVPHGRNGSVRSPRPFYCYAARSARGLAIGREPYGILARLGSEADAIKASGLTRDVALSAEGGSGPDVIIGGNAVDGICAGQIDTRNNRTGEVNDCVTADGDTQDPSTTDIVFGGPGDDYILGDRLDNALHGGPGNDVIEGRDGDDLLIGDQGNDELLGQEGSDMLDTHWVEGVAGEQEKMWTVGSDTSDGGPGEDTLDYRFHRSPVNATGSTANPTTSFDPGTTDRFANIEALGLSKADDVFRVGGTFTSNLSVHGFDGNDQIDVSGNASRDSNQRVYCGNGEDRTSIDVNQHPDTPRSGPDEIMEDGETDCEHTTYRAAH